MHRSRGLSVCYEAIRRRYVCPPLFANRHQLLVQRLQFGWQHVFGLRYIVIRRVMVGEIRYLIATGSIGSVGIVWFIEHVESPPDCEEQAFLPRCAVVYA